MSDEPKKTSESFDKLKLAIFKPKAEIEEELRKERRGEVSSAFADYVREALAPEEMEAVDAIIFVSQNAETGHIKVAFKAKDARYVIALLEQAKISFLSGNPGSF